MTLDPDVKQVLSFANINAEDYVDPDQAAKLCQAANQELDVIVEEHPDKFEAGVGMLAMNNVDASCSLLKLLNQRT